MVWVNLGSSFVRVDLSAGDVCSSILVLQKKASWEEHFWLIWVIDRNYVSLFQVSGQVWL